MNTADKLNAAALVALFGFQAIQFTRAGHLLDPSPLGLLGGVLFGVGASAVLYTVANKAPRVRANKARVTTWAALVGIMLVSPVIVGITNYVTISPLIAGAGRVVFAVAFALVADLLIAAVAFSSGPLDKPAKSDDKPAESGVERGESQPRAGRAKAEPAPSRQEPAMSGWVCPACGVKRWDSEPSQQAKNAHAPYCGKD